MGRLDPGAAGLGHVNPVAGSGDAGPAPDAGGRPQGHPGSARFSVDSDISALAALWSRLQQLQQADPDALRRVLAGVADLLRAEAASSQVTGLLQLADRFQRAAQTGGLESLRPATLVAGPGTPGRHHGVESYGAQQPRFDLAELIREALRLAGLAG